MDSKKLLEENLREAAFNGDLKLTQELIFRGVDINSRNTVNGWTALHWAAYRSQVDVVSYLVRYGADKTIVNNKGELPYDLTCNKHIQIILGGEVLEKEEKKLPIIPNYHRNPPLCVDTKRNVECSISQCDTELVLKLRLGDSGEPNFIEIEIPKSELQMEKLKAICCEELGIDTCSVSKIIKLPNTILRKDKDIQRLKEYQEIEVVLKRESS